MSIEITQLMVNDYVYDYDKRPAQIVCIKADNCSEYEPIPLNAEMLEKNGFVHRQSETWGDFYTLKWFIEQKDKALQYDHHFNITADPYEGTGFYWIPEMSAVPALHIHYVHELQHLMRLVTL